MPPSRAPISRSPFGVIASAPLLSGLPAARSRGFGQHYAIDRGQSTRTGLLHQRSRIADGTSRYAATWAEVLNVTGVAREDQFQPTSCRLDRKDRRVRAYQRRRRITSLVEKIRC